MLSCVKEFSGDSDWRRIGSDEDGDVEAGVDDRDGTWLCTAAVEPAMSKLEGWPGHLEL